MWFMSGYVVCLPCSAGSAARVLPDGGAEMDWDALAVHELPFYDFPETVDLKTDADPDVRCHAGIIFAFINLFNIFEKYIQHYALYYVGFNLVI